MRRLSWSCHSLGADQLQEFAKLDDDANIYKLVGPVLLKQDTTEARSTVDGRLDYIEKEMYLLVLLTPLTLTDQHIASG